MKLNVFTRKKSRFCHCNHWCKCSQICDFWVHRLFQFWTSSDIVAACWWWSRIILIEWIAWRNIRYSNTITLTGNPKNFILVKILTVFFLDSGLWGKLWHSSWASANVAKTRLCEPIKYESCLASKSDSKIMISARISENMWLLIFVIYTV